MVTQVVYLMMGVRSTSTNNSPAAQFRKTQYPNDAIIPTSLYLQGWRKILPDWKVVRFFWNQGILKKQRQFEERVSVGTKVEK